MAKKYVRKVALARQFRRALTEPELMLWSRLKLRNEPGLTFREQHPRGPFILDFYCAGAKLVIEVDGYLHSLDENQARDDRRDNWLKSQKLFVYRIPAPEVYRDADGVADGIRLLALERLQESKKPHHHEPEEGSRSPSPKR